MSRSCDPVDCSPPGSSVHGISQARILEWVASSFSRGSSRPRNRTRVSCTAVCLLNCKWISHPLGHQGSPFYSRAQSPSRVWLFVTPWTIACHAPLSMGILQARTLEWVAMPSCRESPQPRNRTQVSLIAGGFVTVREALKHN